MMSYLSDFDAMASWILGNISPIGVAWISSMNVRVDHLPDGIDAALRQLPALSRFLPVNKRNRLGRLFGSADPLLSRQDRGVIGRDGILTSGHGCTHAWRLWSHAVGADQSRRDSSVDHADAAGSPLSRAAFDRTLRRPVAAGVRPLFSAVTPCLLLVMCSAAPAPIGWVPDRSLPRSGRLRGCGRCGPPRCPIYAALRRFWGDIGTLLSRLRIIWSLHRLRMDRQRPYRTQMT